MKTLMFYSYKGGAGRTVAAANVAAALAKLGSRVAIIDLDFEAPGLQHVFGVEKSAQFEAGSGIQHYLREDIELGALLDEVAIDLFAKGGALHKFQVPDNSLLLYIMASTKVYQVDAQKPRIRELLNNLLAALNAKHNLDYVIIDAASGLRDAYAIAAEVSDEMLMFFRWSTQHVEGTLRMARQVARLKDYGQNWTPFKLIASASPSEREIDAVEDVPLRESLLGIKQRTQTRIEGTLKEYKVEPAEIFHEIPEMPELKWRETINVFVRENSSYEELARKLLKSS
jgi:cellulose biosynthesis protein BcsQ